MHHIFAHKNFLAALTLATAFAIIVSIEVIESVNTSVLDAWMTIAMSVLFSWLMVIAIKVGYDAHHKN